jgi:hypothetical protein
MYDFVLGLIGGIVVGIVGAVLYLAVTGGWYTYELIASPPVVVAHLQYGCEPIDVGGTAYLKCPRFNLWQAHPEAR